MLAFAMLSQAQKAIMSVTQGGGLEMEGCELNVCAYEAGWRSMSVRGDWNVARQDERQFQLLSGNKKAFDGKSRYAQRGDYIMGEIHLP